MSILGKVYLDQSELVDNYYSDLNQFKRSKPKKSERDYLILLKCRYEMQLDFLERIKPNLGLSQKLQLAIHKFSSALEYNAQPELLPDNHRDKILNIYYGDLSNPKFNEIEFHELLSKTKEIIKYIEEKLSRTSLNEGGYDKHLLDEYIWPDTQKKFLDLDRKFRIYRSREGKTKKDLIYYLHLLITEGYFQSDRMGKSRKPYHCRKLIESLYFNEKGALADAHNKYYGKIKKSTNYLYLHLKS